MYTIFTVDVEGHVGTDPIDHLIYGRTSGGKLCGIDLLMDILDQYDIQGLFFVDIAEAWDYGTERIAEVLRHIRNRGHDVGVHIHPDHMADRNRLFLSEYDYAEQYELISRCTDFYDKTLNDNPSMFRAGKYSANKDTLDILAKLNYKVDFSAFYGQKWCHINPPVAKVNVQRLDNNLLEVPVTSYISLDVGFYHRYDKVDCGQHFSEFKTVFDKLNTNNKDIIVLFAHSFSLLNWRRTPNSPQYRHDMRKRLEQQLHYIKKSLNPSSILNSETILSTFQDTTHIDISTEPMISLNGLLPLYWFFDRAMSVIKSRFDIKFRRL